MFGSIGHFSRRGAAALVALWAALAPAAVSATPTVFETVAFARRELNRICSDPDLSRFDRINDSVMFRTCSAEVSASAITIGLRYRSAEGDDPSNAEAKRGGKIETTVKFRNDSWFFCSAHPRRGRVGLHFSCEADVKFDGQSCVERKETARRTDSTVISRVRGQSVAKLMELSPENCEVVERSLNFLVERGVSKRASSTRDYFLQN